VLGASYTRSTVVGDFGALTSTGAGQTMGLNYSHYLPPDGGYRSYLTLGLDDKRFDAAKVNGLPTGQRTRRSRPLSLGYTANVQSDSALWGYDTTLSLNTSGGSGNSLADYRSEDPRITSRNFKVLRANARYLVGFGEGWLWSVRAQAQWSPDALISGEQLGLGGASTLRGTDERPISGDSGLSGTLELTTPEVHPGLRFLGFVDAGWLRNHTPTPNPNPSKPARDQLASVGLGLRYQAGLVALSAEWGRIVTGSDVAAINPSAPRAGDSKLHVNLSLRF
jgi:hemolysin activation/secretion protein